MDKILKIRLINNGCYRVYYANTYFKDNTAIGKLSFRQKPLTREEIDCLMGLDIEDAKKKFIEMRMGNNVSKDNK